MPEITDLLNPCWEIFEVIDLLDVVRDVARSPVIERACASVWVIVVEGPRLASSREQLWETKQR